MRKSWLVLESAPATWDLLRSAPTVIMAITHMPARLMATTVLITFWAACLLAPVPGFTAGAMATTAAATMVAAEGATPIGAGTVTEAAAVT